MRNGSLIERNFDRLIEQVVEEDTNSLIDNGAVSFIPLSFIPLSYHMADNDAINVIGESGKKVNFVIDNGAASFIPLSYYMAENDAINVIGESGKKVIIHTVIIGGQALRDTWGGFASLVEQIAGNAELVVWLNEFFEDIEAEGKTFEEMKVYRNNKTEYLASCASPARPAVRSARK